MFLTKFLVGWYSFYLFFFFHYFLYVGNKVYCILNQNPFLSDNFNINSENVIPTKDILTDAIHIKKSTLKHLVLFEYHLLRCLLSESLFYYCILKRKKYISLLPHA